MTPTPSDLAPALATIGLPQPKSVTLLGEPWTSAHFQLQFGEKSGLPDIALRCVLFWNGTQPLQTEFAALQRAQVIDGLPVAEQLRILPAQHLPWPASVQPFLPGRSGRDLIVENAAYVAPVSDALGQVLSCLESATSEHFGTRIDAGRFSPTRATWSAEWRAIVGHFKARVSTAGSPLQPLFNELMAQLYDALDALDTVTEYSLVHADLHPGNLLFEGPPEALQLTGLIDWESAMLGDPMVDWARPVQQSNALVHIVKAYGPERVREFLNPAPLARLHVYTLTRNLARLAHLESPLFYGDSGERRSYVLETCRQLMADQHVAKLKKRLESALDRTIDHPVNAPISLQAYRLPLWQALEALRFAPLNTLPQVEPFLGAIGACLAARQHPTATQSWCAVAVLAAKRMGPQMKLFPQNSVDDRGLWRSQMIRRVIDALPQNEPPGHCLSVATLGLAFVAFEDLGRAMSDGHLRGLETLLEGLLLVEAHRRERSPSVQTRLTHGLLGWAAVVCLHQTDPDSIEDWDPILHPLKDQTLEAWLDLSVFAKPPSKEPLEDTAWRTWPLTAGVVESGSAVPALLWAIEVLAESGERLPTPATRLFQLLDLPH